jgi:putative spermidine/putrescine transport system substrate-binding protein
VPDKNKLSRRQLLRSGLAAYGAIAVGGLLSACSGGDSPEPGNPIAAAEPFDGTLRVLGLGLDLTDQVQSYAERDLGFTLEFERSSSPVMIERARSQPDSFDVLSGYTYQVDELWPAAQLISLDRARLESWSSVTDLYKVGRAPGIGCTSGDGDAPFQKLYTARGHEAGGPIVVWGKPDGSGPGDSAEPDGLVGAPSTYNLDSLGYNRAEVGREPEDVSWAELFNETWRGRTALFNDPSFGLQSAALAAEAAGLMSFRDKGNMTVEEIDGLVSILASLKQRGQFRTFWSTFNESVNLMATGEVVVQYMWYPAASFLASAGRPVQYAAPPEGYLGWAGLLMFSKSVLNDPSRLQACYDYANWWHAGIPGALLLSLGYYNAAMSTSEPVVAPAEWAYWIEGEPAPSDLSTAFGEGSIPEGQTRDGGSMQTRSCHIGTWLSFFDEQSEYQRERWGELVAS